MFGDFLRFGTPMDDRLDEPVADFKKLPKLFDDYLEEYNLNTTKQMDLVFFKDAVQHLARLIRIIRQPRGNALLVGVGGSGKQSLTRLAAAIADYKCFQIEITKVWFVCVFLVSLSVLHADSSNF